MAELEDLQTTPIVREKLEILEKQIQEQIKQRDILNRLAQEGHIDSAFYMEQQNIIENKLREYRKEKDTCLLKSKQRKEARQTKELIKLIQKEPEYIEKYEKRLFEAVQQRRKERLKEIGKEKSYLYHKDTFMLGDKIKCGECGNDYHCYKHGNTQIWDCSRRLVKGRVTCRNQRIQEEQIIQLFMQVVEKLKKQPNIIRKVTIKTRKNNSRMKAVEREFEMMKNSQNYEVDDLIRLIYKRASLQYEQSDDGSREYHTKKIEKLIQQQKNEETTELDTTLFHTMIKNIVIYQDGRVQFILKNGAIVAEDLSEEKKGERYE